MLFKTVALLALSATTLAHPGMGKRGVHRHHHTWGTGSGGLAAPTGESLPDNGTDNGANGAGSSSAPASAAITETVVPVAPSSSAVVQPAGSSPVEAEIAPSSSSTCTSTMTSTYTSMDYVTMTISSGTSTVSAVANNQVFQPSSSVSLSTTASVSPAGFYQKSSQAGGFGSTSAAPAMTTFATSVMASSVMASSAVPSSSAAPISSGGSVGGSKKGLSYNSASLTSVFANSGMSWAYNWGAAASGTLPSGVSFVPMLWGLNAVSSWSSAAQSAISAGAPAALSFNEPDLSTQSNIDPVTAAKNHIQYMNPLSVPVGSPAITNGAGTSPLMGIDWLNAFFTACDGKCKIDFVAFHWYSDASETSYFQQHVSDVIAAAAAAGVGKVWLTEFGVTGGDASTFLTEVMPFLESTPQVEKYAYFMCASPQTLTGSSLNAVGEVYASTT